MLLQFIAEKEPFLVFFETLKSLIICQFLASGLDGEISLAIGNDRFGRISILHNQITGIAG